MERERSSSTYRAPRLFVEADLAAGAAIPLPREQARYLLTVMRRDAGAPVRVFNGRDGEWLASLVQTGRDKATLSVQTATRPQPQPSGPWLMFALVKRGPMELIAEKATELGAVRLIPVRAKRSNADKLNSERLLRIVTEAAEQSERLDLPEIAPPVALADALAAWPEGRLLLVGDETGGAPPLLALPDMPAGADFGLLVGPEGGFAPEELDALDDFPFVRRVGLGPRVLRAETAAIAGLALAQAAIGDLSAARGGDGSGKEHGGAS